MAAAATMCRSVMRGQAQAPRCLAREGSSAASSGSSCTTDKGAGPRSSEARAPADDDEACSREAGCVTPTSKKHRIPLVDVAACPPAPKKPRAHALLCSEKRHPPNLLHKLGLSPGYLS